MTSVDQIIALVKDDPLSKIKFVQVPPATFDDKISFAIFPVDDQKLLSCGSKVPIFHPHHASE
jgi:hypothetical protein